MSNELLDFEARDNFDFLRIPAIYCVSEEKQTDLKNRCQRVLEAAHKSVLEACKLGIELRELRDSGTWKYVVGEDGSTFQYVNFAKFCRFAFGEEMSESRAKALLNLAQFVERRGDGVAFINDRYGQFSMSKLVEIGSTNEWDRKYFTADMTIKDIRLCKKYMETGAYVADRLYPDFDLLTSARLWEAGEERRKSVPDVLPGQISIGERLELSEEAAGSLTSDLKEEVSEEEKALIEHAREVAHAQGLPFYEGDADEFNPYVYDGKMSVEDYKLMHKLREEARNAGEYDEYDRESRNAEEYDEADEAQEDMRADMQTIEEIALEELEATYKEKRFDFSSREKIRAFLAGYREWENKAIFFEKTFTLYYVELPNGDGLYAQEQYSCADMQTKSLGKTTVRYFWKSREWNEPFLVSKAQIERYLRLHDSEL